MYAKINFNCITEESRIAKEGFTYINLDYDSFVKNKSNYQKSAYGIILRDGKPILKREVKKDTIKEKETPIVDIKQKRLQQIKERFEKAIDMDIKYKNGQYYKPRYASESYEPLLSAELALRISTNGKQTLFPKEIWDATKTQSIIMTFDELKDLSLFLATIYEKQFQEYKKEYAKLLKAN